MTKKWECGIEDCSHEFHSLTAAWEHMSNRHRTRKAPLKKVPETREKEDRPETAFTAFSGP